MARVGAKGSSTIAPNLGLFLDRPTVALNSRMLQDGLNFRVKEGKLSNFNMGWGRFSTFTLNGAVLLIDNFFLRGGSEKLIFGTKTDLYVYNTAGSGSVTYINPIYATGTASASGTAVTGSGTNWDPEAKAGDQIHFGAADYHDPTGTWYTIASRTNDTALVLTASAGTVGNGAYTIRKTFTGDVDDIWITDTFVNSTASNEDEWWATNGVDPPVRWDGTDPEVESMSALGFTCKYLTVYQNMMLFFNLVQGGTNRPTDMINSNPGEPANVSSGLSEQFKVHSGTDQILAAQQIGDALAIYSSNSVVLAQFVGDPLVFVFRRAAIGIGPVGARAIAVFADRHEFVGNDSQYIFDGVTTKASNLQVWREILRQQDPLRIPLLYSHFDEENADLIWSVPLTTDSGSGTVTSPPAKAYVEHYLEPAVSETSRPYSKRTFPFTATGYYSRQTGITWNQLTDQWQNYNFRWNDRFFFASFPLNLAGDSSGKVYSFNTSQEADGAALGSFVLFGRRAVGDGRMRGLVSRIYPYVTKIATPLGVIAHFADHAEGPATINAEFSFDQSLPEGGHFVSVFRRGRFVEIEFGSDGPGQPWELQGYDMDVKVGGRR